MTITDVQLRTRLRQADRVARAGKRAAAEQLYRELLDEAPEATKAWLGLAQVVDAAEQTAVYEQVLRLDPDNKEAKEGLAWLEKGETPPPSLHRTPEPAPAPQPAAPPPPEPTIAEEDYALVCYRHPDRETSLRCYNCNRPICIDCANKTPVGYICPTCQREAEDIFFNSQPTDYLIAPAVALPLSLIAGFLVIRLGGFGGFFLFFIIFAISGGIGSFIGRIAKQAVGRRRGRYLPHVVAGMIVLGALPFMLGPILGVLLGGAGGIFGLIVPGIYLFVATGAAFYQMK